MSLVTFAHVLGQRRHLGGWRRDRADVRDRLRALRGAALPPAADCWALMSRPRDQQAIGSCVGHGIVEVLEAVERRAGGHPVPLAPMFAYDIARVVEGTKLDVDLGCCVRDGIKAAVFYGCAPESEFPYVADRYAAFPSHAVFQAARAHRVAIGAYERIENLQAIREAICDGFPVVFGFDVPQAFTEECSVTGILPWPGEGFTSIGGHCVVAAGYSDTAQAPGSRGGGLWCLNSWGESYGQRGRFLVPYEFVASGRSSDYWVVLGEADA